MLERFRAALPREPVLVVPTPADAEHYQRELSAEGIVVGAEVVTFNRLVRELAAVAGVRARVLGPVGARAARPRGGGRGRPARAGPLRRRARLSGGRRSAVRRARPLADRPGAVHARGARLGGHRRGAVARGRARAAVLGLPPPARQARRGRRRRARAGGARRAARAARRLAWPAGVPLRVRRPDRAPARRDRDAGPPRGRLRRARVRARPRRVRRAGGDGRAAQAARRAPRDPRGPLRALRAGRRERRSITSSAGCSSPARCVARRTGRSGCWRPAASAPRPSWSPPRCSS